MIPGSPRLLRIAPRLLAAAGIALGGYWAASARSLTPGDPIHAAPASAPSPLPPRSGSHDSVALRRAHLPGPFPIETLRVLDGDTIEARVRIWFGQEITTLVRLRGIDAPELKARCGDELRGAEAARDKLAALLASGAVAIEDVALDKYGGRVVASLFVDQPGDAPPLDVAHAMIEAGMARPYAGGRRDNWCPLPPPRVAGG